MLIEGGCYCGGIRYQCTETSVGGSQCHCRECQYISGGNPNLVIIFPASGFMYTRGNPETFSRPDLENPVSREFCGTCGTHLLTRSPGLPDAVIVKVGTLDDPSVFNPGLVIWASQKQWFHHVPEGVAVFDGFPPTRNR